jgi:gamma-glutamylcyclotransferase (GGCT)/AIG2-like uncharacterized protein YtfP
LLLDEAKSSVTGEVYEVDDALLYNLDEFEASSHYRRKQFEISLGAHKKACWVYEPQLEFYSPGVLIASGDWIEHAKTKTDWPEDTPSGEAQS